MAQRTDGHHFETKGRRTKRTYPKLSDSSDEEENAVDRSDTRGNQEDNSYVSDQDKSELNSTLEVDVETSFSASPVSTGYDLRSRRPVHDAGSVGKTKGSPKKSWTPTTSPGSLKKSRTPTTGPAHTSPLAQGRNHGNTQSKIYPDLSESLSSQHTYDRMASASPSPRVKSERRHVVGSPGGDKKKPQGDANRFWYISHVCLPCLGLAVVVLVVWFVLPAKKAVDLPPADTFSDHFKTELLELEQKFPNQNRRLWKTLKAPMRRVLTGKSDRPAVLLFAAVDSNQVTSNCIAKHYAEIITRVFKATSDIRITSGRAGNIKMFIDRSLRSGFSSGSKVALISDLHKMPADPAMLFHAFCDNENAPYKEVAIIFTLRVADNSILPQPPAGDTVVEDYLDVIWSKMDVNDRRALISRIANSVVIASAENSEVIRRHCI